MTELQALYENRYEAVLKDAAEDLARYLVSIFEDQKRIDRICSRAKDPKSFMKKALKADPDGNPKYLNPNTEIQDQIGARVIVFYTSDIEPAKKLINEYLRPIEIKSKHPISDDAFGYTGEHFILLFPDELKKEGIEDRYPEFFELQIKTLFQHAWSEAYHDIGYKATRQLTPIETRQMAFSAAQAWGADRVFVELASSVISPADNDEE